MNWKKTLSILSIGLMISSIFFCSRAVDYTFANPNQPQRWWDEVSVNCSSPTQDGEFTISVQHNGTMNGRRYFGNWVFRIPTTAGMTAADKAAAMREKINKSSGCPLKGGGEGSYVNITAKNGKLHKWNFKSTDGQSLEGLATEYDEGEFSFLGTMEYDGKVKANVDDHRVSVFTNGKTLQQIHQEIVDKLTAQGVNVFLDPYGLAFYVDDEFYLAPNLTICEALDIIGNSKIATC